MSKINYILKMKRFEAHVHDMNKLCEFVNENAIDQEDIQQIITGGSYYTIFYWEAAKLQNQVQEKKE